MQIYNKHTPIMLFLLVIILFLTNCQPQETYPSLDNYTDNDQVINVLKFLKVDIKKTKEIAPNFPNPSAWIDGESTTSYSDEFKKWTENNFEEFQAFANSDEIRSQGFAWESLGFKNPYIVKKYYNSFSQAASILSADRLKEIAPNFPLEKSADNKEEYDALIKNWQQEYIQEYEDWLNAPEILAIKPEGARALVDLGIQAKLPDFMEYPDIDFDYPLKGDEESDKVYALRLQHWYYVYQPDKYEENYGKFPTLPDDFDLDAYVNQYPTEEDTNNQKQ